MASVAAAINQAAPSKTLDSSLWWDSFVSLLTELENLSPPASHPPPSLTKKLEDNKGWLLNTLAFFKPPSVESRSALDSPSIALGSHRVVINTKLTEVALRVGSLLDLNEVQAYILVSRSIEVHQAAVDNKLEAYLPQIMIQYNLERQCLLKCTRQILLHALSIGSSAPETDAIKKFAMELVHDGLERTAFETLMNLLSSKNPEQMLQDVDLANLWAEETLIEDNLILDILFLVYYEPFCACTSEQWKKLCSLFQEVLRGTCNIGRLAVSAEARRSLCHVKIQLLLMLLENLDFENLLLMVQDDVPLSRGHFGFSLEEVQEMDCLISGFCTLNMEEAGPLILAWAVFLCLLSSLPEKEDSNMLMEIDHIGYVRQAFEAAPLKYILGILHSDMLGDSEGPTTGYKSVLKTLIAAFIASYDVTDQLDNGSFNLIVDILCEIYHGQESLCLQFWDKSSFIDGPIRSLLGLLEEEFPYQMVNFVRLLSALSEGSWPAECVYKYLDKMSGMTSLFEVSGAHLSAKTLQLVQTDRHLQFHGIEGLFIPYGTVGAVMKVIDGNVALVRWELPQSGLLVLLVCLCQEFHQINFEEMLTISDLLCRMVTFSTALRIYLTDIGNSLPLRGSLMGGHVEENLRVDVVAIICNVVDNLVSNTCDGKALSKCVTILGMLMKCSPAWVVAKMLRTKLFLPVTDGTLSGMWLLSGGLAKLLSFDIDQNGETMLVSVLDITMSLVEIGAENEVASSLVVFAIQFVLVNNEHWKYQSKHVRWKITFKVFEIMKRCIKSTEELPKLGHVVKDIVLCDHSVHNALLQVLCITSRTLERLYVNRLYDPKEINSLQLALCSALDIVFATLSDLEEDAGMPIFHQALLCYTTKPVPVVTAVMSLISFFRNLEIQVAATRVLSGLCFIAQKAHPYSIGILSFVSDDREVNDLNAAICYILSEERPRSEDLFIATMNLLTSAAHYQPAFLFALFSMEKMVELLSKRSNNMDDKHLSAASTLSSTLMDRPTVDLKVLLLNFVQRSNHLLESHPRILLSVLNFLKTLWLAGDQYMKILEHLCSKMFWEHVSSFVSSITTRKPSSANMNLNSTLTLAYQYQCQSTVLEIMGNDIFLQQKLLHDKSLEHSKVSGDAKRNAGNYSVSIAGAHPGPQHILSNWCEGSIMQDLIKEYTFSIYNHDIVHLAKRAVSLCIVHLISKVLVGDVKYLTLPFTAKIRMIYTKLSEQPAFIELLEQYAMQGYSKTEELHALVLSDLYYHLQGEIEGRQVTYGPFKELMQYLLEIKFLQTNTHKASLDFHSPVNNAYMFLDPMHVQEDMGLEYWDHSDWKASKSIAESMLQHMHKANMVVFLANSQKIVLKALTGVFLVYERSLMEKKPISDAGVISEASLESSLNCVCECMHELVEPLHPATSNSEFKLNFLAAQVELLFNLAECFYRRVSLNTKRKQFLSVCVLVMKKASVILKLLLDIGPYTSGHDNSIKMLLSLLLVSAEFVLSISENSVSDRKDVDHASADICLVTLALLPVLCSCIENSQFCSISVALTDLILRSFLASSTWVPVLQKHLPVLSLVRLLQLDKAFVSITVILNFVLTLARIKEGAEMLHSGNFLLCLKSLFERFLNEKANTHYPEDNSLPGQICSLGMAIVTAMINSIGDDPSRISAMGDTMLYFFSEKAYVIYSLSAPNIPEDDCRNKKARLRKTQTSLTMLRETEHALALTCRLARNNGTWVKAMKGMDSQLRERSIHLLAFISKGPQRIRGFSDESMPFVCPPILKEELQLCERPPFINSKHGWFSHLAWACISKSKMIEIKDSKTATRSMQQTYYSNVVAVQLYRIASLLLNFLSFQAKVAAKRAEEVGIIDLAHFPELPMPEILYGLQDQAVAIVTELCGADKPNQRLPEVQNVCFLLLQIIEKALYLELCVSHICGLQRVSGRDEDFSKEIRALIRVTEDNAFLEASLKSLMQIVAIVYPGLLQSEGML
ncbi:hypothetical protein AMTR_s00041p00195800 [Amborella trichopoda]|uniref:Uncharacterized protein n=2 Tax=Amborella trichopoda TaxID=13333 RepID=W1PTR9_AMBTC|nr:hypothetical protein AMTR_s00041p00195800 [Amborella trichopoda]